MKNNLKGIVIAVGFGALVSLFGIGATFVGPIPFGTDMSVGSDGTVSVGAFTGDITKSAASLATTVVKVNGNTPGNSCSANNVVNSIDTSARGSCAQLSSLNLSDVTDATAMTPSDGSGAGLTFTNVSSHVSIIGHNCLVDFTVTFQATGSAAHAAIAGIPASCQYPGGSKYKNLFCQDFSIGMIHGLLGAVGAQTVSLYNTSGGAYTNAALSEHTVDCNGSYINE